MDPSFVCLNDNGAIKKRAKVERKISERFLYNIYIYIRDPVHWEKKSFQKSIMQKNFLRFSVSDMSL